MQLTVLGIWGGFPRQGGACPGYLLSGEGYNVLIDCGAGVISRLQQVCHWQDLDLIICSHLHTDHMSDLLVLRYAGHVAKRDEGRDSLTIYAPADRTCEWSLLHYRDAFQVKKLSEEVELNVNGLKLSFCRTQHGAETYAVRAEAEGKIFVYSADSGYDPKLVSFARGADLFLCESTLLEQYRSDENVHCTAKDAGAMADQAGVNRLLLTHFWYTIEPDAYVKECSHFYPQVNVEAARELAAYCV